MKNFLILVFSLATIITIVIMLFSNYKIVAHYVVMEHTLSGETREIIGNVHFGSDAHFEEISKLLQNKNVVYENVWGFRHELEGYEALGDIFNHSPIWYHIAPNANWVNGDVSIEEFKLLYEDAKEQDQLLIKLSKMSWLHRLARPLLSHTINQIAKDCKDPVVVKRNSILSRHLLATDNSILLVGEAHLPGIIRILENRGFILTEYKELNVLQK